MKNSQFLSIVEEYLKYKNKKDYNNMRKLEERYNMTFKSVYDYEYINVGDESFLCDYNYKTQKYFVVTSFKLENVKKSEVDRIKNKMKIFMNNEDNEI